MVTLFLIGSIPFWVLTVATIAAIIVAVENEKSVFATLSVALYVGLIHLMGDASLIHWGREHWATMIGLVVAYFAAGTVWGCVKWYLFTNKMASDFEEKYVTAKQSFCTRQKIELGSDQQIPEKHKDDWKVFVTNNIEITQPFSIPQVSLHKARIMGWMSFWPMSLTWTVLNDPIRAAFAHIYRNIYSSLQRMSDKAFSKAVNLRKLDMEKAPVVEAPITAAPASPNTAPEKVDAAKAPVAEDPVKPASGWFGR